MVKEKSAKSEWSAKNPYTSYLTENYILNGEDSGKEARHIVFDLGDSGLEYKAGDALGVVPICPPEIVSDLLSIGGFTGYEEVETNLGVCSLREALSTRYEIHRVSKKWIENLGPKVASDDGSIEIRIVSRDRVSTSDGSSVISWEGSGDEEDTPSGYSQITSPNDPTEVLWKKLTSDSKEMEDYIWTRDYIDTLRDFSNLSFSPQEFIDCMDRLKPRLYSIASSPEHEQGTCLLYTSPSQRESTRSRKPSSA